MLALKLSCYLLLWRNGLMWLSKEWDCWQEWHFIEQILQSVVLQDIPLKIHVKSYCTLDWMYIAQNSKDSFLRACYMLLFCLDGMYRKNNMEILYQPRLCFQLLTWSLKQRASSGEAPIHMYQWRIMAETIASLAFQTYNGIRHQFKFPASFLTSPFSYLVSLKLLKNSWWAAISEMSVETCYFRRTSLITGIYSFLFYFYFLSLFAI